MMKVLRFLDKSEEYIITACMTVMVTVLAVQVFCRYVLNFSFSWAEQLTRILFVWITFVGISLASKKQMHLKMGVLSTYGPAAFKKYIPFVADLMTIVLAIFVFYLISAIFKSQVEKSQTFPSITWLPVWTMYLGGLYGMLGMAIRLFQVRFYPCFFEKKGDR